MPRRSKQRFEFSTIHLDSSSSESLFLQLEQQVRDAIATGLLPMGARVPSSRTLSELLDVSRNTVTTAYQQLISEGYLESVVGSGTRVSRLLPEEFEFRGDSSPDKIGSKHAQSLTAVGKRIADNSAWLPETQTKAVPFRPHLPATDAFPITAWNRLTGEQARLSARQLDVCDPQGYLPLRESIAEYMRVSRGVACTAEQVVVTAGAQQGLSLVLQLLVEREDVVWVEEPGNSPANLLIDIHRSRAVPVPVDDEGIDLSRAPAQGKKPKLIYVTPGGQWPLAMTMSLGRRLQLISVAQQYGSWILEDDYNGEFRYTGRPHPALCSLDQSGRTIYMGTFSKLLFPAIRLGFLIVPTSLSRTFACARWLNDRYSPPLPQMVLHRFIESGLFLKHIRQMRSLYRTRQAYLYDALRRKFGDHIEVDRPESGMHLVVRGRTKQIEMRLATAARQAGVEFHTVEMYSQQPKLARGLILGFSGYDEKQTAKALRRWSREFQKL